MQAQRLHGRVAIVTGAGRGIGRAIALALADQGAVLLATARTQSELGLLVSEVEAKGGRAAVMAADLADPTAPAEIVRTAIATYGTADILVNNAGVVSAADPRPLAEFRDEFWNLTMAVNLTAPYLLCKAVLPTMLKKRRGRIINIASLAGKTGLFHGSAYAASKHGLLGLTRSLALEVANQGITVNAVCPGPVRGAANDKRIQYDADRLGVSVQELECKITPLGRRLDPIEIAPMVLLLAGDESGAVTGQSIHVCGGTLMT
jgi:NAD(P)-dependent dehydrogenase (short-subunit alcohol dehydrogenase family)